MKVNRYTLRFSEHGCNVCAPHQVWRLPGDAILLACVSEATGAEHLTQLSPQEWAALGFQPVATATAREVSEACVDLSACLRIVSTGVLRVEAARRGLFRGDVALPGGQGPVHLDVFDATPLAAPGLASGRAALLVRAKNEPGQTCVLRIAGPALSSLLNGQLEVLALESLSAEQVQYTPSPPKPAPCRPTFMSVVLFSSPRLSQSWCPGCSSTPRTRRAPSCASGRPTPRPSLGPPPRAPLGPTRLGCGLPAREPRGAQRAAQGEWAIEEGGG